MRLALLSGGLFSTAAPTNPPKYKPTNYAVMGFPTCPYYKRASQTALAAQRESNGAIQAILYEYPREQFHVERVKVLAQLGMKPEDHSTCPMVYIFEKTSDGTVVPKEYVGGSDKFHQHLNSRRE